MFSKLGWQVNLLYFSISFLGGWIFMILYTIVIIINKLFKNSLSVACALNACIVWITTQQQRTTFASISLETQVALSALRSELPGLDSPRPGVRMGSLGFLSDKELECFLRWIKVLRLSSLGALDWRPCSILVSQKNPNLQTHSQATLALVGPESPDAIAMSFIIYHAKGWYFRQSQFRNYKI